MELWQRRTLIGEIGSEIWKTSEDDDVEDETQPWKGLVQDLNDFYLDSLCAIFKEKIYTKEPDKRNDDLGLHKEEFVNAINEVFGHDNHSIEAIQLFNNIDKHQKKFITWNNFLDFLGNPNDVILAPKLKLCSPKIYSIPHAEREAITKIVLIESEKHFCYAIVSKYGRVGLYDGNMNFLTSYQIIFAREDVQRTDQERRRRNRWITDAIYLPDIFMFALVTSSRSLIIYDASGLKHVPMWLILGIPFVINSIAYSGVNHKGATLFLGDDTGVITSMKFLQPRMSLFRKKHNERLNVYYWRELPEERNFVIIKNKRNVHKETVNIMEYYTACSSLISCSRDPKVSTKITCTDNKLPSVVYQLRKGICTFAYSQKLHIISTGSDDGLIRVWNCLMTNKPLATLHGHNAGIIDIAILETFQYLLSCSRDAVLILWDLITHKKLQYIKLKFPPFEILGRAIEWGKRCIFPGPKRQNLDVTKRPESCKAKLGDHLEVNKNLIDKKDENNEDGNLLMLIQQQNVWERSYILITCCNFIAQIDVSFFDINIAQNLEAPVLVPPPLQNSVLVPASWNLNNKETEEEYETIEVDDKMAKYIDSLGFVLNKDFLDGPEKKSNLNYKIALLEKHKLKMHNIVSQCAPFLALDLPAIEEVRINPNLTVPNIRKVKSLVDKTHQMLSSASSRSQIFSEASSRSRSTKSSVVEFNL